MIIIPLLNFGPIHSADIISPWGICPANTPREVLLFLDGEEVHGRVGVALGDLMVEGDEGLEGDYLGAVFELEEHVEEAGVEFGGEGVVVDKLHGIC